VAAAEVDYSGSSLVRNEHHAAVRGVPAGADGANSGDRPVHLARLARTVGTCLAKLGVQPHIAERVLSHAQPDVVGVYDRDQYLIEKREGLERWAEHVEGLKPKRT